MRIAFIEPSIAHIEPLGIAYLAAVLRQSGHEVRYFEASRPGFLRRLREFSPRVLAYSVTTGRHLICKELNHSLRGEGDLDCLSLFGGPHCTFFPEFIESDEYIDGVCIGEGEEAFTELINAIERGGDFTTIANWWIKKDGIIHKNEVRAKIASLDSLPNPARDVLYEENRGLRDSPVKWFMTSRGCPFSCAYCFNRKYNILYKDKGAVYRQRSIENIINEAACIKEHYPVSFFRFVDDILGMQMDYEEFARRFSEAIGLPFVCNMRPNLVTEEKMNALKRAGCVAITMAIESGNEFVRNTVLKRNLSMETMEKAIRAIKNAGLRVWTQNIIGNPGESFDMALETFKINAVHRVDLAECFLLTPFPGTEVYDYCVEHDFFDGEVDRIQKSCWLGSSLRFQSSREKKRLVNFQKFFGFAVQHPDFMPLIELLIELPPNVCFLLFNRLYDYWTMRKIFKIKLTVNNVFVLVRNTLQYLFSYFLVKKDWKALIQKETGKKKK